MNWDTYFFNIAKQVSMKSKDPSSKIGAVIVNPDHQIITTGFNGFPRRIDETIANRWDRPIKYQYVEHAERNAIYQAARQGVSVRGCTLYLYGFGPPTVPCIECAKAVIQVGITAIIGMSYKEMPESWINDLTFSKALLREAGVDMYEHLEELR